MDISKYDVVSNAEKGFKLYFKNPYDLTEEFPIFMNVLGSDSKVYKKAKRSQQLEILNENMGKERKTTEADLDRMEQDTIEILTQVVVGLGETEKGKDSDFILDGERECKANKKDIRHLLTKFPWMRDQVAVAIQNRANFLG